MTKRRAACRFGLRPIRRRRRFRIATALGNWVHQVNILPEHSRLRVQAESVVLAHEVPADQRVGCRLANWKSVTRS